MYSSTRTSLFCVSAEQHASDVWNVSNSFVTGTGDGEEHYLGDRWRPTATLRQMCCVEKFEFYYFYLAQPAKTKF